MSLFPPKDTIDKLSTYQTGRLGEILATYYLEMYGIGAEIIRGVGSDLWCRQSDGMMFTCEVKTCHIPYFQSSTCTNPSYRFHIHSDVQRSADIHALVALDIGGVHFMDTSELPVGGKKTLKAHHFSDSWIFPSLETSLKSVLGNKKAA